MPNWVHNKVYFYGDEERIDDLKRFLMTDKSGFDFNKIIPMPEELNLTSGSEENIATACAKARRRGFATCPDFEHSYYAKQMTFDEYANLGEKYLSNVEKYGASTWYDWCINKWGTKWNSADVIWQDNMVCFDTAWSEPEPIFQKLSELYPDIEFSVEFANEDLGSDCGTIDYSNGQFNISYDNDFEFACNVWGYDPEEMKEEYAYE